MKITDLNKHWGAIILSLMLTIAMVACSDNDEPQPQPEPTPDTENLISVKYFVSHPGSFVGDRILNGVNMYFNFMSSNNHEWLRDTPWFENKFKTSDWYFELNGKQYRYNDVMDLPGNTTPIHMTGYRAIDKYMIVPADIPWEKLKEGPLTYSYKFVWPSRNISHTIKIYAVYNQNFEKERDELLKTLKKDEFELIELYKIGYWVDDKPMESPFKNNGLFTIPLEG